MATRAKQSAGILMYRRSARGLEVFLAHPGGPFFARKDLGAWTIPMLTLPARSAAPTLGIGNGAMNCLFAER